MSNHASDAPCSEHGLRGLAPKSVSLSFAHFSIKAAKEAPALGTHHPNHILREDTLKCLEHAAGGKLTLHQLAALPRCFSLDTTTTTITWDEFNASLTKFNEVLAGIGSKEPFTRSRARLLAARRKGMGQGRGQHYGNPASVPLTSSQEIGRHAGGAAGTVPETCNAPEKHAALKGTDVTKGGEGRSLLSYYGPMLGRSF